MERNVSKITEKPELFMLVARQYLERRENGEIVESAARHWPYHGPATHESCKAVQLFVEGDPDNDWSTFYQIVTVTDYNAGVFE